MTRVARSNPKVNSSSPLSLARTAAVLSLIRDLILNESDGVSVSLGDLQDAASEGKLFTRRELEAAVNSLVLGKQIRLVADRDEARIDIFLTKDLAGEGREGAR